MYGNTPIQKQIEAKYHEIAELRKQQIAIAKSEGLREVENYLFMDKDGNEVSLSQLFGDKDELILIHNMGKSCPYCTLWADGLSSSTPHILNRCAFALISPNDWQTMRDFAATRNWMFSCLSAFDTTFIGDMGYSVISEDGKTRYIPGYTTFVKKDARTYRVASDLFGPGDFYSPIWGMLEMLYHSDREWHPKFNY